MDNETNFYAVLGILPSANDQEIQHAYGLRRAELIAADMNDDQGVLDEQLSQLDAAYANLMDKGNRAAFDRAQSQAIVVVNAPAGQTAHNNVLNTTIPISIPDIQAKPSLQRPCPHCGVQNPAKAKTCLSCQRQISRSCPECGYAVPLGQVACARCATVMHELDQERLQASLIAEKKTIEQREGSRLRVEANEKQHSINAAYGVVFWLIVFAILGGLIFAYLYFSASFAPA